MHINMIFLLFISAITQMFSVVDTVKHVKIYIFKVSFQHKVALQKGSADQSYPSWWVEAAVHSVVYFKISGECDWVGRITITGKKQEYRIFGTKRNAAAFHQLGSVRTRNRENILQWNQRRLSPAQPLRPLKLVHGERPTKQQHSWNIKLL